MAEWRFELIQNTTSHNTTSHKKLFGVDIPAEWQTWEEAYFNRISATLRNSNYTAQLLEGGCDNGDAEGLNCTKTCGNKQFMFMSPQNLWNCMTLSAVTVKVSGNSSRDTVNEESLREMDDRFHFGSLDEFGKLTPFEQLRDCLWQSCSDSKYGKCSPDLVTYQCRSVGLSNIDHFGSAVAGNYCSYAEPGVDSDIAGQGIIVAYIIQGFLALLVSGYLILDMLWKVFQNRWTKRSRQTTFEPQRDTLPFPSLPRASGAFCRFLQRMPEAVDSTLVDFQEAQVFFAGTISSVAIAAFAGYTGLGNVASVYSYFVNVHMARHLVTINMVPLLMVQSAVQIQSTEADVPTTAGYTLIFVVINWVLVFKLNTSIQIKPKYFAEHLRRVSGIDACGGNPGPMSFCQGPLSQPKYIFKRQAFVNYAHFLTAVLVIYWLAHFRARHLSRWLGRPSPHYFTRIPDQFKVLLTMTVFIFHCVGSLLMAAGLVDLFELFRDLYSPSSPKGDKPWSFGQLIAMVVWLPVVSKFLYIWYFGVEEGVQRRIDDAFVVSRRSTAISPAEENSKEARSESGPLISPTEETGLASTELGDMRDSMDAQSEDLSNMPQTHPSSSLGGTK